MDNINVIGETLTIIQDDIDDNKYYTIGEGYKVDISTSTSIFESYMHIEPLNTYYMPVGIVGYQLKYWQDSSKVPNVVFQSCLFRDNIQQLRYSLTTVDGSTIPTDTYYMYFWFLCKRISS